ncbi:MAG: cell division protein ZapD [Steroidobacteraceae bacterium]|jgi:cell division protein ZapD
MSEGSADEAAPAPAGNGGPLVFEQPLNERMRAYLRIDFLYNQALFHAHSRSPWGSRASIASLLDILAIITRSDTRADVLKELERQIAVYTEFQRRPNIDVDRLQALVANLGRLRTELLSADASWMQPLRDSTFLAAIRHRSTIPGGTCDFDLPDFSFWLSQAGEVREQALAEWLGLLRPLCDSIAELLWLARQGGRARSEIAANGVFHITFDRGSPVQLLRVAVAAELGLFPEISGSHYRASVRFVSWQGLSERARQIEADVPFELICCH